MDPIQNQPQTGMPNTSPITPPASPMNGHKKVGPIIATLIIVLVLIIAALYLFASRLNQQAIPTDGSAADGSTDQGTTTESVQAVTNTSDDPQSLQSDLNASTQGLDSQNF